MLEWTNPYDRVRGYQQVCQKRCTGHCMHILEFMFFVDVDGTLSDFMRTIYWYTYSVRNRLDHKNLYLNHI